MKDYNLFTTRMAALDDRAIEDAASVFMSYLPNNNRANTDADRQAARNIVATYLHALEWHGRPVVAATEDHPAIYRDGHRLTASKPAAPHTEDGANG